MGEASGVSNEELTRMRKEFKGGLERILWKFHEIQNTVLDYNQSNQQLLADRINEVIDELPKLYDNKGALDLEVPLALLSHLDEGGNPDSFTKEIFKDAMRQNQISKGKITALQDARKELLTHLESNFPDKTKQYRKLSEQQKQSEETKVEQT